jgi:hypothetical protein
VLRLVREIVASGEGILEDQVEPEASDPCCDRRLRGLPIGNLTSQFWSNCYLNSFDHFVKRELRCRGYVRYVDDMALFSDSRQELWAWKAAVRERLGTLRLRIHERSAQVTPVSVGIPWLGFVVYPSHRKVKARCVRTFTRRIRLAWEQYHLGALSFGEFDARVQGWINHVRFGDTWGLRGSALGRIPLSLSPKCLHDWGPLQGTRGDSRGQARRW